MQQRFVEYFLLNGLAICKIICFNNLTEILSKLVDNLGVNLETIEMISLELVGAKNSDVSNGCLTVAKTLPPGCLIFFVALVPKFTKKSLSTLLLI